MVCVVYMLYTCYIHYTWVHNKSQGFASTATIKYITYYHLYTNIYAHNNDNIQRGGKRKASEGNREKLHSWKARTPLENSFRVVSAFNKISIWCSHGI